MSRRERDRLQRRKDIFGAAELVFAKKGYHDASIEEIARTAEYGTGTVYLYFKDKETLYVELYEEKVRALFEFVMKRIGNEKEPLEALQRLVQARMEYFEENRSFFEIYMYERMDWVGWTNQSKWKGICRLYDSYIELLARLIRSAQRRGLVRGGDSRQFAIALSGMMRQLTRDWLQSKTERPLTGETEFVMQLFLQGARQKA